MLLELRIENMALIDSLRLDLTSRGNGLFVFTGETGAGKSIILQALHLLAGGRGAAGWIRSDCEQAVVEALFSLSGNQAEVKRLLQENEIEQEDECLIRRIFFRNGRSRFYVNDRLVTAGFVGELSENLVNIASQHDHQQLLVARHHLDFLDLYAELWERRTGFSAAYGRWQHTVNRLNELRRQERDKEQRRDFLTYQLREIRAARLVPGEDEQLAEERDRLKSSGALAELAGASLDLLQAGMLQNLGQIRRNIEQAAQLDRELQPLCERMKSSFYEIEDMEISLRKYLDAIPGDASRLDEISERLALFKQLQRKYGSTMEEVIEHGRRLEQELNELEGMEQETSRLEKESAMLGAEVQAQAAELSRLRRDGAARLTSAMQQELASLNFPQAVFEVDFAGAAAGDQSATTATGQDQVEFLFSANPGEPAKPLVKVASGGELSRLMLAMKCLLARRDQVETVVFDEVDAGIGGKAAEAVARKISELSSHHQVLCITHLPQIAARADEHLMVAKSVTNGRTVSSMLLLDAEQRVMELARMLGGEKLTRQTIAYARELAEGRENTL